MNSQVKVFYFFIWSVSSLITLTLSVSASTIELTSLSRSKRNVAQLLSLLVKDSPYKFTKLANYGNWCGKGGDLMGDGSYIDGCDFCCKHHDQCYHRTRTIYESCNPILTVYDFRHGETNPEVDSKDLSSSEERELRQKLRVPSCSSEDNEAPSCKEAVCQCKKNDLLSVKFPILIT
jgi:hypothetical protein